jgi:hypothetical protein
VERRVEMVPKKVISVLRFAAISEIIMEMRRLATVR